MTVKIVVPTSGNLDFGDIAAMGIVLGLGLNQ
jgi:hypothetical protein